MKVAYTSKGIQVVHGMSRLTMLGIMGVVEWWWWGGELSLVESVGAKFGMCWKHVLSALGFLGSVASNLPKLSSEGSM